MPEHRLCVIPGDGIGQEVVPIAVEILTALMPDIIVSEAEAGWTVFQRTGTALPSETLDLARKTGAVLFGAVASPSHPVTGYRSPIVALRRELEIFLQSASLAHMAGTGSGQPDGFDGGSRKHGRLIRWTRTNGGRYSLSPSASSADKGLYEWPRLHLIWLNERGEG